MVEYDDGTAVLQCHVMFSAVPVYATIHTRQKNHTTIVKTKTCVASSPTTVVKNGSTQNKTKTCVVPKRMVHWS